MKNNQSEFLKSRRIVIHYSNVEKVISRYFVFFFDLSERGEVGSEGEGIFINAFDYIDFVISNIKKGNTRLLFHIKEGIIIEDTCTQIGKFIQRKTEDLLTEYRRDPLSSYDAIIDKFFRFKQKIQKGIKPHEWFHTISDFTDIVTQMRLRLVHDIDKYKGMYKADVIYKKDKDFIRQLTSTFLELLKKRDSDLLDRKITEYLNSLFFDPLYALNYDSVALDLKFKDKESIHLPQIIQSLRETDDLSKHFVGIWIDTSYSSENTTGLWKITVFFKLNGKNIGTIIMSLKQALLYRLSLILRISLNPMHAFDETENMLRVGSELIEANSRLIELQLKKESKLDFERCFFIALSLISLSIHNLDLRISDLEQANAFIRQKLKLSSLASVDSAVKRYSSAMSISEYLNEKQETIYLAINSGADFYKNAPEGELYHSVNAVRILVSCLLTVPPDNYNFVLLRSVYKTEEKQKVFAYINCFDLICNSLSLSIRLRMLIIMGIWHFMQTQSKA